MKKEVMLFTLEGKIAFVSSIFFLFFLLLIKVTSNPEWIGIYEVVKSKYLDAAVWTGAALSFEFCLCVAPKSLCSSKSQINMLRALIILPWAFVFNGLFSYLSIYFRFSDYSKYYLIWYISLFFLIFLAFFFMIRAEKFKKGKG